MLKSVSLCAGTVRSTPARCRSAAGSSAKCCCTSCSASAGSHVADHDHRHAVRAVPLSGRTRSSRSRGERSQDLRQCRSAAARRSASPASRTGSCLSVRREPAPSRPRHSSSTTPRSLSTSSGSSDMPAAKSCSAVRPVLDVARPDRSARRACRWSRRTTVEALTCGPKRAPIDSRKVTSSPGLKFSRAVERHVLDEVREPALIVLLLNRAGVDGQTHRDAIGRPRVVADEDT